MTPQTQSLKTEVGVRELHNRLSAYVNDVATTGKEIYVTSHGKRVARLVPVEAEDPFAEMRARGKLSTPKNTGWMPRPDRPRPRGGNVSDIVIEHRR